MLPRLYVIRHGETAWSLAGRHTGGTDVPLTTHGEDEARALGQRLRAIPFDHVMTSPALRARRTGELAALNPAATVEPDLAEWNYGDYAGQRTLDIQKARRDWNLFRDGCPFGETPAQVSDRADRLLVRLRRMEGHIALFSHGHFGRVLGARWIGLTVEHAQHFLASTASLSVLAYEPDRSDQPVIALWNDVSHKSSGSPPLISSDDIQVIKPRAIERWENEGGEIPEVAQNERRR